MPKIKSPDFDPDASTDQVSSYELKRLQTIEANRRMLQQLSIPSLITDIRAPIVKKESVPKASKKINTLKIKPYLTRAQAKEKGLYIAESFTVEKQRIITRTAKKRMEEEERMRKLVDEDGEGIELDTKTRFPQHPKVNYFGHIPNIPVGTIFRTRMECSYAGVHRPTVAGIYGTYDKGCYSICFSGGYDDDIDQGEYILFSGSGGRDLKGTASNPKNLRTAPQTFDQEWTGNNLMLKISAENKRPIRVVRGYKGRAPYAPEEGYRYDGLYVIEQFTRKKGKSGFLICQFKMKRLADQAPLKY